MAISSGNAFMPSRREAVRKHEATVHDELRRGQVASIIILVIFLFQLVNLPGAIFDQSMMDIGTIMLGMLLCMVAVLFNRLGWVKVVSALIIVVIDLGCGLMVLASPMGLDVSSLSVFDLLILSELIAVSLLPLISVFWVATGNVLFIIVTIVFMPRTPEMQMLLSSNMAYTAITQPLCLQIIVAIVMYVWVYNSVKAHVKADGAQQLYELRRKEIEQQQLLLDLQIKHLLETVMMVSNHNYTARAKLSQGSTLWQVGNGLNILIARLQRLSTVERDNHHLQAQVNQLKELIYRMHSQAQQKTTSSDLPRGL